MSAPIECPICMDPIELCKNCVTTECGHQFHTSCLMKSVAHNGFACPYCRDEMAEEPEEDESEEDENSYYSYDDYDLDDSLRGLRFFWNNLNSEEHDPEDVRDEEDLIVLSQERVHVRAETTPPVEYLAKKLAEQISYTDLVKAYIQDYDEYNYCYDDLSLCNNKIFGKVQAELARYRPGQEVEAEEKPRQRRLVVPLPGETHYDSRADAKAQPKISRNIVNETI